MHVFISSSSSLIMRLRRLLLVVKPSSKSNAISRKHGQFLLLIAPTFDKKKKHIRLELSMVYLKYVCLNIVDLMQGDAFICGYIQNFTHESEGQVFSFNRFSD